MSENKVSFSAPLCDCPCHSSGNTFPCGAMCWHPGVDQFGMPLSYDHASITQLLRAVIARGKDERIESALWESLFLSATEAASGVHTPVAANNALDELRKWLADLVVSSHDSLHL
jgi:hypothetical protein